MCPKSNFGCMSRPQEVMGGTSVHQHLNRSPVHNSVHKAKIASVLPLVVSQGAQTLHWLADSRLHPPRRLHRRLRWHLFFVFKTAIRRFSSYQFCHQVLWSNSSWTQDNLEHAFDCSCMHLHSAEVQHKSWGEVQAQLPHLCYDLQ